MRRYYTRWVSSIVTTCFQTTRKICFKSPLERIGFFWRCCQLVNNFKPLWALQYWRHRKYKFMLRILKRIFGMIQPFSYILKSYSHWSLTKWGENFSEWPKMMPHCVKFTPAIQGYYCAITSDRLTSVFFHEAEVVLLYLCLRFAILGLTVKRRHFVVLIWKLFLNGIFMSARCRSLTFIRKQLLLIL